MSSHLIQKFLYFSSKIFFNSKELVLFSLEKEKGCTLTTRNRLTICKTFFLSFALSFAGLDPQKLLDGK
jgi:hypothetical protein